MFVFTNTTIVSPSLLAIIADIVFIIICNEIDRSTSSIFSLNRSLSEISPFRTIVLKVFLQL